MNYRHEIQVSTEISNFRPTRRADGDHATHEEAPNAVFFYRGDFEDGMELDTTIADAARCLRQAEATSEKPRNKQYIRRLLAEVEGWDRSFPAGSDVVVVSLS